MQNKFDRSGAFTVYFIRNENGRVYAGKTCDLPRRLRQHNGELAGGARYTRGRGPWRPVATVTGFETDVQALQAEWRLRKALRKARSPCAAIAKACRDLLSRGVGWTRSSPRPDDQALCVSVASSEMAAATGFDLALGTVVPEHWAFHVVDDPDRGPEAFLPYGPDAFFPGGKEDL
jgi:predicted GIY-YIG superfamily endonuclease